MYVIRRAAEKGGGFVARMGSPAGGAYTYDIRYVKLYPSVEEAKKDLASNETIMPIEEAR